MKYFTVYKKRLMHSVSTLISNEVNRTSGSLGLFTGAFGNSNAEIEIKQKKDNWYGIVTEVAKFTGRWPLRNQETLHYTTKQTRLRMSKKITSADLDFKNMTLKNIIDLILDLAVLYEKRLIGRVRNKQANQKRWDVHIQNCRLSNDFEIDFNNLTKSEKKHLENIFEQINKLSVKNSIFKSPKIVKKSYQKQTGWGNIHDQLTFRLTSDNIIALTRYTSWRKTEACCSLDFPTMKKVKSKYVTPRGYTYYFPK